MFIYAKLNLKFLAFVTANPYVHKVPALQKNLQN